MTKSNTIVTIGINPCWDITCSGKGIDWHRHMPIESISSRPAGKALNVCRALHWMGCKSIAAGLWGRDDHSQMLAQLRDLRKLLKVNFTVVPGQTRQNITVIDTKKNREMHLRSQSTLLSLSNLRRLRRDIAGIVKKDNLCVLAGAMPGNECLPEILSLIETCQKKGARLVVDTSGAALSAIVNTGSPWLIKPNVQELRELLDRDINDSPVSLVRACGELLDKVEMILLSRGSRGAILVTRNFAIQGRHLGRGPRVHSTVACGDYLLAGFLAQLPVTNNQNINKATLTRALKSALTAGTAKAWALTEQLSWPQTQRRIKINLDSV